MYFKFFLLHIRLPPYVSPIWVGYGSMSVPFMMLWPMRVIPSILPLSFGVIFESSNAFPKIIVVSENRNRHKALVVKKTSSVSKHDWSLSVSVIYDSNRVHGPYSLEKLGTCDYAAVLQHPSGCATTNACGKGCGWFGTLMII